MNSSKSHLNNNETTIQRVSEKSRHPFFCAENLVSKKHIKSTKQDSKIKNNKSHQTNTNHKINHHSNPREKHSKSVA